MRTPILALLAVLSFSSQGQWTTITYPYFGFQRAVHCLDANTGFVGAYGRVRKTTDGGATWSQVELNGPDAVILNVLDIMAVHAIDANNVVVGGTNNALSTEMIARTSDGGTVWDIVHTGPGGSALNDLHFPSTTVGYAVGDGGRILKTVDGGTTWIAQTSGSGADLNGVYFRDLLRGMAVGDDVILITTNGGSSWASVPVIGYLSGIEAFGSSSWVACGDGGVIWLSQDDGATWLDRSIPLDAATTRLTVSSGGRISVAGEASIYVTDNLGLLWERYRFAASIGEVNDIYAPASMGGTGYAVSEGGKVLKTSNVSGPAYPIALFQPSNYTACVGVPISFQNLSSPAYTSIWKVNGAVVGTSTDLNTTFNQAGLIEVRLVVSNGIYSDSTSTLIDVVNIPGPAPAPTVMTFPASVCPGTLMTIQVNNSTPNILYQVYVNGTPFGGPMGGGSWSFQFPSMPAILGNVYTVVSSRVTPCGTFIDDTFAVPINIVPLADPNVSVSVSPTLMCDPGAPVLTISPSQVGINYRVSGQYYAGNGGTLTITLPVPFQSMTYTVVGRNALNCDITMATAPTLTYAPMDPNFNLSTTTPFVGQQVNVLDNSTATTYAWSLGVNATPSTSSVQSPSMSYSTTGPDTITVYMSNAQGCDRTVKRGIHVYEPAPLDQGEACRVNLMGLPGWAQSGPFHHVIGHHISEDGATYLCGYYSNDQFPNTYNYFLRKLDADGNVLWTQAADALQYLSYNYRSSFANAITSDGQGNIYLAGSFSSNYFRFGTLTFQYSQVNTNPFIVKMDPDGNAQWAIIGLVPGTADCGSTDLLRMEDGSLWAIMKAAGNGFMQDATGAQIAFGSLHRDKLVRFNEQGQVLQVNGFGPLFPINGTGAGLYNPNATSWTGGKIATVAPRMRALPDGRIAVVGDISGPANVLFGNEVIALTEPATVMGGYVAVFDPINGWSNAFLTYSSEQTIQGGTGRTSQRVFPAFAVDDEGNIGIATSWSRRIVGSPSFFRFVLGDGEVQVGDSGSVLMKWSPDGQLLWKRRNQHLMARDLEWDGQRFVLLAEYRRFMGLESAQPPSLGTGGAGNLDAGIATYSSAGDVLSVVPLGSTNVDCAYNMVVHPCGGVQVPGVAGASLAVSGQQLNGNNYELYVMRYASAAECVVASCPTITLSAPNDAASYACTVFPNPANGTTLLQLPIGTSQPRAIEAMDASGRLVALPWQRNSDQVVLQVDALSPGVYSLRITYARGDHLRASLVVNR